MKNIPLMLSILATSHLAAQVPTQVPPQLRATQYEGYPVLKSDELLKPEVLIGPHHTILDAVPTQGFANQYTIDTKWGFFTVYGNAQLAKRITEFNAIDRLEHASKSDEFKHSLRQAAASPFIAVGGALQDPKGALKSIGSGAQRFIGKVGESIDRGGKKSANTDNAMESLLGVSKAKREIASYLKIDPYTDNQVLQQRLDDMGRATFAGGFIVKAGTFAVSAGAGSQVAAVVNNVNLLNNVGNLVWDHDPIALSKINRDRLAGLGVTEVGASAFVEHPLITPTQQTYLVAHLCRMTGAGGVEKFLKMTRASKTTSDVDFFVQTAGMMADYHERVAPVKVILELSGLPAIHAADKALVIPLAVDYGSWTEKADKLSAAILDYTPQVEISERRLWISGRLTLLARKELEARGFVVTDGTNIPLYR